VQENIKEQEAQGMQQSLFEYAPRSNPAADYKKIYKMIEQEG
jgi:hypothetical protein